MKTAIKTEGESVSRAAQRFEDIFSPSLLNPGSDRFLKPARKEQEFIEP
jgi:hypothetical protein